MKKIYTLAIGLLLGMGCTAITDFGDIEDSDELYSLENALSNPVDVDLLGDGTGMITLDLLAPVPEVEGGDSVLLEMLGDAIGLVVRNNETSVTVDLINGTYVEGTPANPGEYHIALSADRTQITVNFVNSSVEGRSLHVDGDYTALISVHPNDVFLSTTADIEREIVVSNAL